MFEWDACVVGVCQERGEVAGVISNLLPDLDREYEPLIYNFSDNYSFYAYFKLKRVKDLAEIVEESIDEVISKPLNPNLLIEDFKDDFERMPSTFRVKPVVFKGHSSGARMSIVELFEIREYILVWKKLASIIFYFMQMEEGRELADYLKRHHFPVYHEILTQRSVLKNTIISEFVTLLE